MNTGNFIGRLAYRATWVLLACIAGLICAGPLAAAQLNPKAAQAFVQYILATEAQADTGLAQHKDFLCPDQLAQWQRNQDYTELRNGKILIKHNDRCAVANCPATPGALIHDWTGLVFVPGVSLPHALAVLQDYGRDSTYYSEQVVESKLLERTADHFHVFLRLKQVEVITVEFDTEYQIQYRRLDAVHACSRSHSTRVQEVEYPGTSRERDLPAGDDRGFLWRLNSYLRFYQSDGGVYIQCEAISLTRNVPNGLGWLIGPFIEKIPAKSLRETLSETRAALLQKSHVHQEGLQ